MRRFICKRFFGFLKNKNKIQEKILLKMAMDNVKILQILKKCGKKWYIVYFRYGLI